MPPRTKKRNEGDPQTQSIEVAYDAYKQQVDHNLDTAGASDALAAAVEKGDLKAAQKAVKVMVSDACGKAKMLWLGSPEGTILRNKVTKTSATRAINAAGIPLWQCSGVDGSKWDSHEPVLTPEGEWKCIYDPTAADG